MTSGWCCVFCVGTEEDSAGCAFMVLTLYCKQQSGIKLILNKSPN